jgi:HEPN domain-containing protein
VLVASQANFPYTHNIARLITIVQDVGIAWPTDLDEAAELTEFAVQLRYPGVPRQVTDDDLRRAAQIAKRVFDWAENVIT